MKFRFVPNEAGNTVERIERLDGEAMTLTSDTEPVDFVVDEWKRADCVPFSSVAPGSEPVSSIATLTLSTTSMVPLFQAIMSELAPNEEVDINPFTGSVVFNLIHHGFGHDADDAPCSGGVAMRVTQDSIHINVDTTSEQIEGVYQMLTRHAETMLTLRTAVTGYPVSGSEDSKPSMLVYDGAEIVIKDVQGVITSDSNAVTNAALAAVVESDAMDAVTGALESENNSNGDTEDADVAAATCEPLEPIEKLDGESAKELPDEDAPSNIEDLIAEVPEDGAQEEEQPASTTEDGGADEAGALAVDPDDVLVVRKRSLTKQIFKVTAYGVAASVVLLAGFTGFLLTMEPSASPLGDMADSAHMVTQQIADVFRTFFQSRSPIALP